MAGRVGATTRAFLCRSTRRAGHLHRRVTRQPGHTIFRASGGKSDRFDAFVLCELARTDHWGWTSGRS